MQVLPRGNGFLAAGGALVAGALVMAGLDHDTSTHVRAGACVDRDARPAACADHRAVYQVLTTGGDRCPDGDYVEKRSGADLLCLGYKVAAGDCVQDAPTGPVLVRCTTTTQTPPSGFSRSSKTERPSRHAGRSTATR